MRYSKISPDSDITLRSESGNTPDKAINEAIEFVKEHGLKSVDLNYGGFTMYIDPDVDIKQLVSEFYNWRTLKQSEVKDQQVLVCSKKNCNELVYEFGQCFKHYCISEHQ